MNWWPQAEPLAAALASLACAVAGTALLTAGVHHPPASMPAQPSAPTTSTPTVGSPAAAGPRPSITSGLPRSEPTTLTIARIGVHTPLISLGLQRDGTPEVPPLGSRSPAGWLSVLHTPGEIGPAVILGHVDSAADGPAVFHRLDELRPGDLITVDRADRRRVRFVVSSVERVAKADFPATTIYGPVDYPALRLITCGGYFDHTSGHYRDNVIVYAHASG